MKFCPKCNEICSDQSKFCSSCGYSFYDNTDSVTVDTDSNDEGEKVLQSLVNDETESDNEVEVPKLTLDPPERPKKEGTLHMIRVPDDTAIREPAEVYIDDELVGVIHYDSERRFPVGFGKHTLRIEADGEVRQREIEITEESPEKRYRFSIRHHNTTVEKKHKKKKHIFAKVICTILVLLGALIMFIPADTFNNASSSSTVPATPAPTSQVVDTLKPPVSAGQPSDAPSSIAQPSAAPSSEPTTRSSSAVASYESIYNEYAEKIRAATPGLVQEYKNEAAGKSGDIMALANISNSKIEKLAVISNEGIEKMAQVMWTKSGTSYEEYSDWSGKLYDVYMEEAQKLTDAYMSDGVGAFGF